MEILKKYSVLVLLVLGIASCGEKEKPVALSPELTAKKLSMTVSKVLDKDVSVYLISEEAVEGELIAKALNQTSQEIGRASQIITLGADDAKMITFKFDAELDVENVVKYLIDLKKDSS